uniref:Protein kinase-related n=1 Tax=Musa acuminata TaxID=4641 RepID=Q1EPB0_MUSAC|nr:protein kinase-related [Musa acuminata]
MDLRQGKLPNGLLVTTKVLEKIKGNSQDFGNEVATINRIHHVNITQHLGFYCDVNVIQLLGFCCDGMLRALIYKRCWQQVATQDFNVSLIGELEDFGGCLMASSLKLRLRRLVVGGAAPKPDGGFDSNSEVEVVGGWSSGQ